MSTSEKRAPKPVASDGGMGSEGKEPEEFREEIEETRGELGDTVAAVAEKTDVKEQAKAKVEDVKAQAAAKAGETRTLAKQNPVPLAMAAAVVGLLVLRRLRR